MVIIKEKSGENTLNFPKNTAKTAENLTLQLHSIVENRDFSYELDVNCTRNYYTCRVSLANLADGEYEYTLFNDGIEEKGLLIIGNIKQERKERNEEYNKEVTYIEYNG